MSNFEDIIKEKANQFEAPYNEAHWLATKKKLKIAKTNLLLKKVFYTVIAVSAISTIGYFIFSPSTINKDKSISSLPNNTISNETPVSTIHSDEKENTFTESKENRHVSQNDDQKEVNKTEEISNISATTIEKENLTNLPASSDNNSSLPENKNEITPEFYVNFKLNKTKICLGEVIKFEPSTYKNVSYTWNFGDGNTSSESSPNYIYQKPGIYTISLKGIDLKTGKSIINEQKEVITVLPTPEASFTYTEEAEMHDDNKILYPYTQFKTHIDNTNTYVWNFGNGNTSKVSSPRIIFDEKGDYKTTLIVTNKQGCSNSSTAIVSNKNAFVLYAPNAFSPNQDGENDVFMPKALLTWDISFEMMIKNKSGELIFKTNNANEGWNGKLNNLGATLDQDIYFWQIITFDSDGISHQHAGKINLIK